MTIASKARSGVKSPVLKVHGVRSHFDMVVERKGHAEIKRTGKRRKPGKKREEMERKKKALFS